MRSLADTVLYVMTVESIYYVAEYRELSRAESYKTCARKLHSLSRFCAEGRWIGGLALLGPLTQRQVHFVN